MIRNISANEVCSSGCVCFYAKNGVPCEQTLRIVLLARRAKEGELAAIRVRDREDKSLRHFAMAEKFWMTTNQKNTQKVNLLCYKLHRSYSILFNLANLRELFSG